MKTKAMFPNLCVWPIQHQNTITHPWSATRRSNLNTPWTCTKLVHITMMGKTKTPEASRWVIQNATFRNDALWTPSGRGIKNKTPKEQTKLYKLVVNNYNIYLSLTGEYQALKSNSQKHQVRQCKTKHSHQ